VPCVSITSEEYKKLIKENEDLHSTLLILRGNEKILQENIENHKKTIENHEKTIEELRIINSELKKDIELLKGTILKHEETINNLVSDINDLKSREETRDKADKLRVMKEKRMKIYMAIQDFNKYQQLYKILSVNDMVYIKKIRKKRVVSCHYIDDDLDIMIKLIE
jgi:predicted RNase H-like nuclease (RuvC/YqgF family)